MATGNFENLATHFADQNSARELVEHIRWPNGPVCPHCGSTEAYALVGKSGSKSPVRQGVYKCKACRQQFTVTVGTIFEDSRIPLNKWLYAIHLMCSSKKGVSAHQLHRTLGITYKSAWFMVHRIRHGIRQSPLAEKLSGTIETDETYVGGKPRKGDSSKPSKRGRGTSKTPVVVMVERNGKSRAQKMKWITKKNLHEFIGKNATEDSRMMTDGFKSYNGLDQTFASHETVDHMTGEYARGDVNTNTAESWFSLLKRGVYGTFHHVSEKHLDRYVHEFVFRWNYRDVIDIERTFQAINLTSGKRLTYEGLIRDKES